MRTIELEIDDRTLELAEQAARARECTVSQLLRDLLEKLPSNRQVADPWLGMLADEPELADFVVESAMEARQTQPLRQPHRG
ncbi:MAG: hypothetical protein ABSG68_19820 [Thermoguttaceae bacterium]|jgi:hypothetical protein